MAASAVWTSPAVVLRDSVGVCTHPAAFDTVHAREPEIAQKVAALGVVHVRNEIAWSSDGPWNNIVWANMAAWGKAGVRSSWRIDRCGQNGAGKSHTDLLSKISQLDPLAPVAIEGTNEADYSCSGGFPAAERAHTQGVFEAVRSHPDPRIRNLAVYGPSFAGNGPTAIGNIAGWITHGNTHPYAGGDPPSKDHVRRAAIESYRPAGGTRPVVCTEVGFHTATQNPRNPDGWPTNGAQPATDERTQAIYTVRTVLQHFREAVVRTYFYEAVDLHPSPKDPESSFGLLRNDLSYKPAATALKRLISTVGVSAPGRPSQLVVGFSVLPPGMQALAFQRRGGSYALAVWRQDSCWDKLAQQPKTVVPQPVRLELPNASLVKSKDMGTGHVDTLSLSSQKVVEFELAEAPKVVVIR